METAYIFDYNKEIDEVVFENEEETNERIWEITKRTSRA